METPRRWSRKDLWLAALATLVLLWAAAPEALAQGQYQIGDRVECDPSQIGQFKPGTIVPFPKNETERSGRFFYVLLDGSHITEGYLCMATHMRKLGPPTAAPPTPVASSTAPPLSAPSPSGTRGEAPGVRNPGPGKTNPGDRVLTLPSEGGVPALPGTAWKMNFGIKGGNVQRILFCRSGRWEVVSSQLMAGAVSLMGTYKVSGSTLALTGDGRTTNYRISKSGEGLLLTGGKQDMNLYEPVPTQCK